MRSAARGDLHELCDLPLAGGCDCRVVRFEMSEPLVFALTVNILIVGLSALHVAFFSEQMKPRHP